MPVNSEAMRALGTSMPNNQIATPELGTESRRHRVDSTVPPERRMTVVTASTVAVADLVAELRLQPHRVTPVQPRTPVPRLTVRPAIDGEVLLVLAAHPGAGATTVAVAIADALALAVGTGSTGVELVDAAPMDSSGLIAATECEIDAPDPRWRAGRRGTTRVLRPVSPASTPPDLPSSVPTDRSHVIVDAGWPLRIVLAGKNLVSSLVEHAQVIVVCRATVPGVRHAELALRALPGRHHVAAVGGRRWPRAAEASFGPLLAAAVEDGRVVLIPRDGGLEINGVDADPLPRAVVSAAAELGELVWPGAAGASARKRRGLRSR